MSRPPRLDGFPYLGFHRYFLTICTDHREAHGVSEEAVNLVVTQFLRSAADEGFAIPVYCVMPDHMHLLAGGDRDGADLRRFVNGAKQRAGYYFKRRFGDRLWQPGYWERVLRESERSDAVIAYIVRNPIRARLVSNAEDYPYWGSDRYTRAEILQFVGDASHQWRSGESRWRD